jgi:hypothetical protein
MEPLVSRRKVSTAPWFIEPKTGAHVKRHWEPGIPVGTLEDFKEKLELDKMDRVLRRPRQRR